ncbi:Ethanolamine-phosphate cytidylyltransferase (CTP:phosphoethanolamine cytidylyltransferase) (Phosphorylethanolamine transferase) [Durusdinium trenchii]|uniref:ethanolamine-phosphate cytidylyltransferase n=1 Tax=Durusdinium trenchii TaxID=1381693 RepID=A0ABP0STM4_9DINO
MTEEFLKEHDIHVCAVGQEYFDRYPNPDDDPYYKVPRKMGIAVPLPRFEGLSTSDLIRRIRERASPDWTVSSLPSPTGDALGTRASDDYHRKECLSEPRKNVYCDGIFDMCHIGHQNLFRNASKLGTHVFVGVVGDKDANSYKRPPIMTAAEREAQVLGCKDVDRVIPNALCFGMTEEFLKEHDIHVCAVGQEYFDRYPNPDDDPYYKVPRKMGIAAHAAQTIELIHPYSFEGQALQAAELWLKGDGLQYALALRSAVIYVLGICSVPLLFPCTDSPEAPLTSWASCPKSPYSFIPTNLMHIFHILPFWYAFLVTPYLGGLVKAIVDAILGVGLGLAAASLLNLLLPGGAAGPNYLAPEYFEQAWLPFRYSTFSAFMLALCFTYGLFVSSLSLGKKQYALGLFSELLVPFMSPTTRTGFRAVCWDWDFAWNWNGAAMCGLWLVLLAVLLSVFTLGLLPHRRSIEMHTARWASALALAQLAEDTGGCLEYLMTILQQDAWKFQFHAESSNFYIKHLGLRLTRAEMILDLTPWEGGSDLTTVVAFLRQLRQLLRIQSEQMRYFGQTIPKGEQLKLVDFLQACNEGLALVASDCRSHADLTKESCAELQRIADKADEVLVQSLRSLAENDKTLWSQIRLALSCPVSEFSDCPVNDRWLAISHTMLGSGVLATDMQSPVSIP